MPALWMLLACMPLLAQAADLSGLRVLPTTGGDYRFGGWQSEGELPATLAVPWNWATTSMAPPCGCSRRSRARPGASASSTKPAIAWARKVRTGT
ncbi:hypothetical protein H1235_02540 [Pseudoxanthomonas sp. NC8]|nr:hypothetical protein H1235_02540 [Pseudoxanthomonas sp. NC8]